VRGLPDPTLMIGQENNLNNKVKAEVKVKVELNRRGLSKEKYKLYLCKYLC